MMGPKTNNQLIQERYDNLILFYYFEKDHQNIKLTLNNMVKAPEDVEVLKHYTKARNKGIITKKELANLLYKRAEFVDGLFQKLK